MGVPGAGIKAVDGDTFQAGGRREAVRDEPLGGLPDGSRAVCSGAAVDQR